MSNEKNKAKVEFIRWRYSKMGDHKDVGPVVERGKILRLFCWRHKVRILYGWESTYMAVVTGDAKIEERKKNFLDEDNTRAAISVAKCKTMDSAFRRAYKVADKMNGEAA